ncbi:MAG: hypothetical protein JO043_08645 [Candidatus Eremiobacteraeota bacterium]|nr:hypothetical protein [Candidatus Eremiobacteraeota bacterium]
MAKDRTPAPYRDLSTLLRDAGLSGEETSGEATRARVQRALSTFERAGKTRMQAERIERQFAIINRCDLGGQLHKVVASDLGISMRTFYRERVEAFERLRKALAADRGTPSSSQAPPPSATAVHLERARLMAAQGRLREAAARLGELPQADGDALVAATVAARLSSVWWRLDEPSRATQSLARAKRCAALLGNGAHHAVAVAEIGMAEALQACAECNPAAALTILGRLVDGPHPRTPSASYARYATPEATETYRAAFVLFIEACLESGAAQRARSMLAAASGVFEGLRCPVDLRLDASLAAAEAELIAGGDPAAALRVAAEASSLAGEHALPRHTVRAHLVIALANAALGDGNAARAALVTALEHAAGSLIAGDARRAALECAGIAVEIGEAPLAARALEAAGAAQTGNQANPALATLRQAEALLLQRRNRDALGIAREANRVLAESGSRRHYGEALLTLAKALSACGEHRAARSAASEAVGFLEGSSWPWRVREARRLARLAWHEPADSRVRGGRELTAS